jgi:hypothetical protein
LERGIKGGEVTIKHIYEAKRNKGLETMG